MRTHNVPIVRLCN